VARKRHAFGLRLMATTDAVPFWYNANLSWRSIVWAALLTLIGAVIVGILPGLKVTKRSLHDAMRSQGAGSGLRFGAF